MKVLELSEHRSLVFGREGSFLINRHDFYMGRALATYGECGQAEVDTLQTLLTEGDVVIEVGANMGAHTVGLAKKVGRRGKVYAYEPQRQCHALLQAQIALNNLDQVIAIPEGCGAQEGTMWHAPCDYDRLGNFGAVTLVQAPQPGYQPVRVRSLDAAHAGERVRLLKVDVEGMEFEVLSGARQLIAAQRPILYLENDRAANSKRLLELVLGMGYRAWWHLCPLFNPANFFGEQNNIYQNINSFNILCLPTPVDLGPDALSGEVDINTPHPLASA